LTDDCPRKQSPGLDEARWWLEADVESIKVARKSWEETGLPRAPRSDEAKKAAVPARSQPQRHASTTGPKTKAEARFEASRRDS
jgi:hypothetical protein